MDGTCEVKDAGLSSERRNNGMNHLAKEKVLHWAVIVFIVLNAVTLALLWVNRGGCRERVGRHVGPRPFPGDMGPMPAVRFEQCPPGPMPGHGPPQGTIPAPGGPPPPGFEVLGLDDEQKEALETLRQGYFKKVEAVNTEVNALKKELFDLLSEEAIDEGKIAQKIEALSAKRSEADLLTVEHFRKILGMLEGDQKKMFIEIMKQALQGPPPPPPVRHGSKID
jgi:hypothetical protein